MLKLKRKYEVVAMCESDECYKTDKFVVNDLSEASSDLRMAGWRVVSNDGSTRMLCPMHAMRAKVEGGFATKVSVAKLRKAIVAVEDEEE